MKQYPDFRHELPFWQKDTYVIGLDEVGRGCLAGPVHVGGVCFPMLSPALQSTLLTLKIHDSKQCSAVKRAKLAPDIQKYALSWHIASSSVEEINTLGIVPAIEKASAAIVQKLASKLPQTASFIVFTDTIRIKALDTLKIANKKPIIQFPLPQADATTITVAAASILAKVVRDTQMEKLHMQFPHYDWSSNKGYATKTHRDAIKQYGVSLYHRTLFVRNALKT